MDGIILKAISGFYYVADDTKTIRCKARGRFRREKITPLVGDRARITLTDGDNGVIDELLPRKNTFVRPPVANLDQMVIIASAVIPITDPFLVDRIAVIAEYNNCEPIICVNKTDENAGNELYEIYKNAGFVTIRTSAVTGEGIDELKKCITGKVSAFTGNSGVGKSSILNALQPDFNILVGEVSEKLGRGRHTTRHVELYTLNCGAVVADTPGFSSFDTDMMSLTDEHSLDLYFRDFAPFRDSCGFSDCSHTKENNCAVCKAVCDGLISPSRYNSYTRLYEQTKAVNEWDKK